LARWDLLVECLADHVLRDDDYSMARAFLDLDPREGRERRKLLGIADDYYRAVAPDSDDEELEQARRTLGQLTGCR